MSKTRRSSWLTALLLVAGAASGETVEFEWTGHLKGRALYDALPDNSVFRSIAGSGAESAETEFRLQLEARRGRFTFDAGYQAYAIAGDSARIADALSLASGPAVAGVLDDRRRWFDLTDVIDTSDSHRVLHRLDRLSVGWTSDSLVLRFGRQALSWGGGLFFSPFDIVNPFDPAAVDTEYKTGDDMLYAQYLRENGDDIQFAAVRRRDPVTGRESADEATTAFKYHGIAGDSEYDVMIAENRGRSTIGIGGNRAVGGAVVRADVVVAEGERWRTEALLNVSWSFMLFQKNATLSAEYFYNGWGRADGRYDTVLGSEQGERLAAGESYTLGRNYLAAGMTIELTPLTLVTPNLFVNLDDPSALLQVVVQRSLGDNVTMLGALNLPLGPDGSEFGGVQAGSGLYFSRSGGLFAQLAWYF